MPASPELCIADDPKRDHAAAALAEHVRVTIEQARRPTPEQMERLRELLPPPRSRVVAHPAAAARAAAADPIEAEPIVA